MRPARVRDGAGGARHARDGHDAVQVCLPAPTGGTRPPDEPAAGPGACPCSGASARPVAACATIAGRFVSVARA